MCVCVCVCVCVCMCVVVFVDSGEYFKREPLREIPIVYFSLLEFSYLAMLCCLCTTSLHILPNISRQNFITRIYFTPHPIYAKNELFISCTFVRQSTFPLPCARDLGLLLAAKKVHKNDDAKKMWH